MPHRNDGYRLEQRLSRQPKRRWANQRILELESRNLVCIHHSSLFVENFMIKFTWEDLKIQGRVRPPPSETAFSR